MRIVTPIQTQLETATGTKPFIVLRVWWNYNQNVIKYYGDRPYGSLVESKIISLSGIDSIAKTNGIGGSTGNVSVTLDDSDGSIKTIIDTYDVHKCWCFIYQLYDVSGTPGVIEDVGALLYQGQLSTPIVWDEHKRTISFDIVNIVEGSEIGFTVEQGAFQGFDKEEVGKGWPCVFGSCLHVPAVKIKTRPSAKSLTAFSSISLGELTTLSKKYEAWARLKKQITAIEAKNIASWTDENLKPYKENTAKLSELANEIIELLEQMSGKNKAIYEYVNEYYGYIQDWWDYKLLIEEGEGRKTTLTLTIANLTKDLQTGTASAQEIELKTKHKVEATTELDVLNVNLPIWQNHLAQADVNIKTSSLKLGFNNIADKLDIVFDGPDLAAANPQEILINGLRIEGYVHSNNKFRWEGVLPTETSINLTARPANTSTLFNTFWLPQSQTANLKNKFCYLKSQNETFHRLVYVKEHEKTDNENACTFEPVLYKLDDESKKYEILLLDQTYKIVETCPFIRSTWLLDSSRPLETGYPPYTENWLEWHTRLDKDFVLKIGDTIQAGGFYPDLYVCNMLSDDQYSDIVYQVCAKKNGVLQPVPKSYYNIIYNYRIGNIYTTLIQFPVPLESLDEKWGDDIYVTLASNLRNAFGTYVGNNPARIIRYLVDRHTNYTPDSAQFALAETYLDKFPMNFALTERKNVLQLIEELAWQARCAVWIQNNVVHIKYLPTKGSESVTITEEDILFGSVQVSYSNTDDLCTCMTCKWRRDHHVTKDDIVIIRNNIAKYGKLEHQYEFYAYNNKDIVKRCATFWLMRYSNSWKKIKFKGFMHLLPLEAYDTVYLNFTHNWLADSGVYGYVESVNYDSDTNLLDFEIWVAVRSGEMFEYPVAWPHDCSSGATFPTAYDAYVGGYTDANSYNVSGSGTDILGIGYSSSHGDTGTRLISDTDAPVVQNPILNIVQPNTISKRRPPAPNVKSVVKKIDITETKFYDPRTGFEGTLDTLIAIVKGPYNKEFEASTEAEQQQYLALRHDALVYGNKRVPVEDDSFDSSNSPPNILEYIARMPFYYDDIRQYWIPAFKSTFFAKIISATEMSAGKWKYSWQECDDTGALVGDDARQTNEDYVETFAYNLTEISGNQQEPIATNSVVLMYEWSFADKVRYAFQSGSGGGGSMTFAIVSSKAGDNPPYAYTCVQANMVNIQGGWQEVQGGQVYSPVYNIEEQGSGGQFVNPLYSGDVVLITKPNPSINAYACVRSHYRGTYVA